MSKRDAIFVAAAAVCVALAVYSVFGSKHWGRDRRVTDILERGQHIRVVCINPGCSYESDQYRAHSTDVAWPWACPKCGKKTLCRAQPCMYCGQLTATLPLTGKRTWITCTQCGRRIPLLPNAVDVEAEGRKAAEKPAPGTAP